MNQPGYFLEDRIGRNQKTAVLVDLLLAQPNLSSEDRITLENVRQRISFSA